MEPLKVGDVIEFPEHAQGAMVPTGSSMIYTHGAPGKFRVTGFDERGEVLLKRLTPREIKAWARRHKEERRKP